MHLYQIMQASFFGAPFQSIQESLIRINGVNWRPKLARQHYGLTPRTAACVNNDFKPVLRERPQNIQTKAIVSWTQLFHICEQQVNRIRSFHSARMNYCAFALAVRICGNKMSRT
jgi:hypothetical protein